MDQTTPTQISANPNALTLVIPITVALAIGTGGIQTIAHTEMRKHHSAYFEQKPDQSDSALAREMSRIKTVLRLSMKDMAACLGVSRPTVYSWMAGGTMKPENFAKLENLKDASAIIASANIPQIPLLFQRKLPNGKTLVESLSSGENGREAASSLVQLIKEEALQRRSLNEWFAERSKET